MLFGPADRSELSLIVSPTEPSAPVLRMSPACNRAPAAAGTIRPPRSIDTLPFATLICPISAASAGMTNATAKAAIDIQDVGANGVGIGAPKERRRAARRIAALLAARSLRAQVTAAAHSIPGSGALSTVLRRAIAAARL